MLLRQNHVVTGHQKRRYPKQQLYDVKPPEEAAPDRHAEPAVPPPFQGPFCTSDSDGEAGSAVGSACSNFEYWIWFESSPPALASSSAPARRMILPRRSRHLPLRTCGRCRHVGRESLALFESRASQGTFHLPSLRYSSVVDAMARSFSSPPVSLIVSSSTLMMPQMLLLNISNVASNTNDHPCALSTKVTCVEPVDIETQ
eukprot:CAMPEP_0172579092 /NCGR_PEP_ID=MMETSP1067-20121228/139070_1 /TAXON_ID=265564 ORGANISM="Thalassiosira punctigera, Strain Tpunct2005C2" /NCGR_SAMPLE_ID=MMETSP1067 /ASSEMBLY_ACC=CAM_ASM_000444 /LENGTH=200 /DNA_ID=CAMNT_0013371801 /DNA_START=393 /DNA_END=996 /DNA_ORIENTATION=-